MCMYNFENHIIWGHMDGMGRKGRGGLVLVLENFIYDNIIGRVIGLFVLIYATKSC